MPYMLVNAFHMIPPAAAQLDPTADKITIVFASIVASSIGAMIKMLIATAIVD